MSGKNSSIDQIWCRVLTETLIPDHNLGVPFQPKYTVISIEIVGFFSKPATQRPRQAYFVNRRTTFRNERSFNFSEHQKNEIHTKFIQKSEKSEKFRKFRKSGILIFNTIYNGQNSKIILKFPDFLEILKNFKNISDFSLF